MKNIVYIEDWIIDHGWFVLSYIWKNTDKAIAVTHRCNHKGIPLRLNESACIFINNELQCRSCKKIAPPAIKTVLMMWEFKIGQKKQTK